MKLIHKLFVLAAITVITGCSSKNQPLVIWTDNVEFASYTELFNASQKDIKAVCIYKENILDSLPAKKGERRPDILAGSWLRSGMHHNQFASAGRVFNDAVNPENFYSSLLESGKRGNTQYLIPVSFNIPVVVFDLNHSDDLKKKGSSTSISVEEIREFSAEFNKTTRDGLYTKMAFAPQWNTDFLYLLLASRGISFTFKSNQILYNTQLLSDYRTYIEEWTTSINTSTNDEKDFAFKYLYTPSYKQVLQNRSLFAFDYSNNIMALPDELISKIDFRWVTSNSKTYAAENDIMAGIYRRSHNKSAAVKFLQWFFNPKNQEQMLKRKTSMNLDTINFGLAGGFSSIREVNERILPVYYHCLMANVPDAQSIKAPGVYPPFWKEIKADIIIPYITAELNHSQNIVSITQQYADWLKARHEE